METLLANSSLARLFAMVTLPLLITAVAVAVAVFTGLAGRVALVCEDLSYRFTTRRTPSVTERTL